MFDLQSNAFALSCCMLSPLLWTGLASPSSPAMVVELGAVQCMTPGVIYTLANIDYFLKDGKVGGVTYTLANTEYV